MADSALPISEQSLDPRDWAQARALGHRMIDDAVATEKTYLKGKVYLDTRALKAEPGKAAAALP